MHMPRYAKQVKVLRTHSGYKTERKASKSLHPTSPSVTCAPARGRQTAMRKQKARAEEWIKSEDGITETMTGPNGVYVRFVSAPADDEEQDYAVRAGGIVT